MPANPRISALIALACATVPFAFGAIRLATTGSDYRYLIMALMAALASGISLFLPVRKEGWLGGLGLIAANSFFAATAVALLTARSLGATAVSGMVIVAMSFACFLTAAVVIRVKARTRIA